MEKVLVKNQTLEILAMCKANAKQEDNKLMFVELGRDMFKDKPNILNKYFKNKDNQDCYYANLLAFKGIEGINTYEIKKQLKQDFGKEVSLAGYKYNPEHYRYASCIQQNEHDEELFKNKTTEEERAEFEAERRARIEELDFDAVESLYAVLFKALKVRWVMLLNLESIPGILNNALDCYYKGVNCSMSNAAMHSKIAEIRRLMEDEEMIKWLKTKPTDLMFDKFDYVDTYQRVLRQITDISNENLEYIKELIENPEDLWVEDILNNEYLDTEPLYENNSDDDEDEEYY